MRFVCFEETVQNRRCLFTPVSCFCLCKYKEEVAVAWSYRQRSLHMAINMLGLIVIASRFTVLTLFVVAFNYHHLGLKAVHTEEATLNRLVLTMTLPTTGNTL